MDQQTQAKDTSCGDDITSRPRSEQGRDVSLGKKEEGCCSTDKEHADKTKAEKISKDQLLKKINKA